MNTNKIDELAAALRNEWASTSWDDIDETLRDRYRETIKTLCSGEYASPYRDADQVTSQTSIDPTQPTIYGGRVHLHGLSWSDYAWDSIEQWAKRSCTRGSQTNESVILEMKPYAGEKSGHKNMRDVDKWSESRPHGEVGRPQGYAHVKKKPGKSASRQIGKRASTQTDESVGVRKFNDCDSCGKPRQDPDDILCDSCRAKQRKTPVARVKESMLRRIVREEFARINEGPPLIPLSARRKQTAVPNHEEIDKAMAKANELLNAGEDELSVGFQLEKMGFMPNVVDAVMDKLA